MYNQEEMNFIGDNITVYRRKTTVCALNMYGMSWPGNGLIKSMK